MFEIKNEKNKSAVILSPERREWVSRSHVTSVESVVNDGAKTKRYSVKRDLYARSPKGSRLKMTRKALSFLRLRGASGAQGISATASCREAHKRRLLNYLRIRRFLEFFASAKNREDRSFLTPAALVLALFLFFNVSAARAVTCTFTPDINNPGKYKLSVTGTDTDNVFSGENCDKLPSEYSSSWYNTMQNITSAEFDNNITEIEQFTFCEAEALTSVDMPNVQTLRMNAFAGATSLTSVNMPNMQTVGESAFNSTSLISVDMPNVTTIERAAFYGTKALQYIGFDPTKLSTDNIGERAFSYWDPEAGSNKSFDVWDSCNKTTGICGSCGDKYLQTGLGCVSECGEGYTADSTVKQCVASQQVSESDCYANGQVFYQDACVDEYPFAKKHWTPAEANQWLYDDNNTVIMTFKVNR